jgi:hypothetical protein
LQDAQRTEAHGHEQGTHDLQGERLERHQHKKAVRAGKSTKKSKGRDIKLATRTWRTSRWGRWPPSR